MYCKPYIPHCQNTVFNIKKQKSVHWGYLAIGHAPQMRTPFTPPWPIWRRKNSPKIRPHYISMSNQYPSFVFYYRCWTFILGHFSPIACDLWFPIFENRTTSRPRPTIPVQWPVWRRIICSHIYSTVTSTAGYCTLHDTTNLCFLGKASCCWILRHLSAVLLPSPCLQVYVYCRYHIILHARKCVVIVPYHGGGRRK